MTDYRRHDIDALVTETGQWRAYVDMYEVGEAETRDAAMNMARRYVNAEWRRQFLGRYGRRIADNEQSATPRFTVITGGRDG